MRILTHNFLQSNVKGTEKGYPLLIEPVLVHMEDEPSAVDEELVHRLLPKLDYSAIVQATKQLASALTTTTTEPHRTLPELPDILPDPIDGAFVRMLHTVLFDVHLQEGYLICPDTGRKFPVKDGIPNMILHEDEI